MEKLMKFAREIAPGTQITDAEEAVNVITERFTNAQNEIQKYKDIIERKEAEIAANERVEELATKILNEESSEGDEQVREEVRELVKTTTYAQVLKDPLRYNKLLTEEEIQFIRERHYPFDMDE